MASYSLNLKAFKLEGVPELTRTLGQIYATLNVQATEDLNKRLKDVMLKPAMVIRDEAKDLVPVRTGKLRDAIYAEPGISTKPDAIAGVAVRRVPYAIYVEHGTSRMAAQPFFRPAVLATRPLVANMIAGDLKELIEYVAERYAWHGQLTP